jgi:hypothetical protein
MKNCYVISTEKEIEYLTTPHKLLMKMLKRSGHKTGPCGTPYEASYGKKSAPQ